MKILKKIAAYILAAFVAVAALMLIGAPAQASDQPETLTHRWILPNGGTPDNVTWPQPRATEEALAAVACGTTVWIQVDTGPNDERGNSFGDVLEWGEDHGWVEYWSFEQYTAPACIPPAPPAEPGSDSWDEEPICTPGAAERSITSWAQDWHRDPAWNGTEWVFGDKILDGEPRVWQVVVEPYEACLPPVVVDEPAPPVTKEEPQLAAVEAGLLLAETGPDEERATIALWGAAGLLALGLVMMGLGRILPSRKN